jgi:hypothetical protein
MTLESMAEVEQGDTGVAVRVRVILPPSLSAVLGK